MRWTRHVTQIRKQINVYGQCLKEPEGTECLKQMYKFQMISDKEAVMI
jgi:hypothetical protein